MASSTFKEFRFETQMSSNNDIIDIINVLNVLAQGITVKSSQSIIRPPLALWSVNRIIDSPD